MYRMTHLCTDKYVNLQLKERIYHTLDDEVIAVEYYGLTEAERIRTIGHLRVQMGFEINEIVVSEASPCTYNICACKVR